MPGNVLFMGTNNCVLVTAAALTMVHILLEGISVRAVFVDERNKYHGDRASAEAGMKDSADALMSCFNSKFKPNPAPFIDFVNANPSQSFFLHRVWWSKQTSTFALSGFTSLDMSRLQMLESQCLSFPGGVIAAAVWQPLIETKPVARDFHGVPQLSPNNVQLLANTTNRLKELFKRMEAAKNPSWSSGSVAFGPSGSSLKSPQQATAACNLRLLLVAELVADEQMAIIMPINAIRNAAFLAVDSPLAAMVDVDLSISAGLAARVLSNQTRAEELVWRSHWEHVAWVLPTFDIHKNVSRLEKNAAVDEALAVPPNGKTTQLRSLWRERHRIHPFAADRYAVGHNATDYDRWFATYEEYPSGFQEGYEPWFMGPRRAMPPYDVRIRGRYHDKITNVRHAMKLLHFRVAPDIWLVHRPHGFSTSHLGYKNTHSDGSWALDKVIDVNGTKSTAADLYLKADQRFFRDVITRTNNNSYNGVADETWYHCRSELAWWRGTFPMGPALKTTL